MDIKKYYGPDGLRTQVQAPFNFGGRTIATTGFMLISLPADDQYKELDATENASFLSILKSVLADIDQATYRPMPSITLPEPYVCGLCEGTKIVTRLTCPECDGSGEVALENDYNVYEVDCDSCFGKGFIGADSQEDCPECSGVGKMFGQNQYFEIGSVHIAPRSLQCIINEPGLQISVIKEKDILLFKFGGAKGAIKGMSK